MNDPRPAPTADDTADRDALRATGSRSPPNRPTGDGPDLRGTGGEPIPGRAAAYRTDDPARPDRDTSDGEPATLLSGRVGTWDDAARVREALLGAGFASDDIEVFYTGPAGRHGVTPIGGDAGTDAGSQNAGKGAAVGGTTGAAVGVAVAAAVATGPVIGAVLLTGAALGAFGGALVGGVAATEDGSTKVDSREHPVAKPGGVVVAVRVDAGAAAPGAMREVEARALRCLDDGGAIGLERAQGRWRDGSWVDWDPVAPREQIAPEPGTPQA